VGSIQGLYSQRPNGVILHGSRSSRSWSTAKEFESTRNFAARGAGGLGWSATIGEEEDATHGTVPAYSVHMTPRQWGYNARSESSKRLAVEFAQARLSDPITDDQIAAFAHWYEHEIVPVWGELDVDDDGDMPCHSELSEGARDGKSDTFLSHSAEANDLRERIREAIG
jgi:hypothetical protein